MGAGFRSPFLFLGIGGGFTSQPTPPELTAWTLGARWSQAVICAKQGSYGLQRSADAVTADSNVTATYSLTVSPGKSLFAAFWVKAGATANGVIGFGFAFYDAGGIFLSSSFLETTGFPTTWTQIQGNIAVPAMAASAIPILRATGHTLGIWCVDSTFSSYSGGHFTLAAIKHFYSDYASSR